MPAVSQNPSASYIYRFFITLGSVVLVVAALYWAKTVLVPVALAVLVAFLLTPAASYLERRGLGRVPSMLIVVTLALVLLAGTVLVIASQVRGLLAQLPEYRQNIQEKVKGWGQNSLVESYNNAAEFITHDILQIKEPGDATESGPQPVPVRPEASRLTQFWEVLGPATEYLAQTALVVVLVGFMLVQREDLRNRVVGLAGRGHLVSMTRALDESARRISRYLLAYLIVNVCMGLAIALMMTLLGTVLPGGEPLARYALLWGFLTAVLRFVPYVGTWSTGVLMTLYAVAVCEGWLAPVLVFALFAGLETLAGQVLEPVLWGHSIGVSPVALLISLAFWTWLWGPIGLLLATPLTACLVVMARYVPSLEFIDVLMGSGPVLSRHVQFYQRLLARDEDEAADLIEEQAKTLPLETVYDEVLLPALALAKADRDRGALPADDEKFILQATEEILDDLDAPGHAAAPPDACALPGGADDRPKVLVFGCPARSRADELALQMFRRVLEASGPCRVEVLSSQVLAAEVHARVRDERPALVCIAALPPGGLAQTRHLCKRLRAASADVKIVVGRWGDKDLADAVRQRLTQAGADQIGVTLQETRCQVAPLVQVAVRSPRVAKVEPQSAGAR